MSTTLRKPGDASSVGRLLQHWRKTRRKSQLSLALSAGVSARHVGWRRPCTTKWRVAS